MNRYYQLPLGELGANCYIIPAEDGKAVVVDPASSAEVLMFLQSNDLSLGAIVITHGHFDHFAGVPALVRDTGAEVIAPLLDKEMLQSADKSWADFMPRTTFEPVFPDRTFSDGEEFSACGLTFGVMGAPGHTAGSCLLFCKTLGDVALTGDVIFAGAIGRFDGYSASVSDTRATLKKIAALKGDYTLLCGHGEATSLSFEKQNNVYLAEA